jgi:GMP synthase-like glutamine amidotransferase
MVAMRALVFGNRDDDDLGVVGDWAEERKFDIERVSREEITTRPVEVDAYDLVISLGSVWSVYWPAISDTLRPELDALRRAVDIGIPVLGICFGGQMLAAALGAEVTRAPEPEIGWIEIDSDIPDLVAPGPWMQWHVDRFTVPDGAIELARTPLASQAFRVGRSLGLQFHPEVDAAIVKRWAADGDEELRAAHVRATDVIADSERHEQRARADAYRLCDGFWTTIATS